MIGIAEALGMILALQAAQASALYLIFYRLGTFKGEVTALKQSLNSLKGRFDNEMVFTKARRA